MNRETKILLFAAAAAVLILSNMDDLKKMLFDWLAKEENFSPAPYWDVTRWSWGYGTRVPGSIDNPAKKPNKTITRDKAAADTLAHFTADQNYLKKLIKVPLSTPQWVALLSFSYNLGPGNADNLVANINAGNLAALKTQWLKYVNDAKGNYRADLARRRQREINLFLANPVKTA